MEGIKSAVSGLCGMELLKMLFSLLLPEGSVKRFAQYAFAIIQNTLLINMITQMLQMLNGVFT